MWRDFRRAPKPCDQLPPSQKSTSPHYSPGTGLPPQLQHSFQKLPVQGMVPKTIGSELFCTSMKKPFPNNTLNTIAHPKVLQNGKPTQNGDPQEASWVLMGTQTKPKCWADPKYSSLTLQKPWKTTQRGTAISTTLAQAGAPLRVVAAKKSHWDAAGAPCSREPGCGHQQQGVLLGGSWKPPGLAQQAETPGSSLFP